MGFVEADRFLLASFTRPFAQNTCSNIAAIGSNALTVESLVKGNVIGDILLGMTAPDTFLPGRINKEDVNVTATQILLALKVYKMQHGTLPKSLSELVPVFFPEVPIDDFDGKPFRYLPDKKIIYSVGPCLKDLGGEEKKGESEDYNLPFKIEF